MKSIVGGDNYNAKLEEFMFKDFNSVQQVNEETTDYHSKLDLLFTNASHIDHTGVIDNCWSDHKMVYTALPLSKMLPLPL